MRLSIILGGVYLASEILLTLARRGRIKTDEKQDRSDEVGEDGELGMADGARKR